MIITFYTSKGGAGKSTALVSALGAIAHAKRDQDQAALTWKVLALEFDAQGTIRDFFSFREAKNLPSYGIDYLSMDFRDEIKPTDIEELYKEYDIILIDTPGIRDANSMALAMVSDLLIVPTSIVYTETRPAQETSNFFNEIINEYSMKSKVAMLLTRMHKSMRFWDRATKELHTGLLDAGYPFLDAFLSDQQAAKVMMQTGFYPMEQADLASKNKSPFNMMEEGEAFLHALLNMTIYIREPAQEGVN